nr:hypothetical protein [Tanacetum cinerariifolium]
MVAYLTKSDASEGFNQIIDFLNGSSIKYALTVNPNIYVSCIKQFWTTIAVKNVNEVIRLQALVDKKKVVATEATIREALCLDDVEGAECLPNEKIFAELARMGYEKPSTKLTFYKAFSQASGKNKLVIFQPISLSTLPRSDPKVFANIRRVGKGFSGVETPFFEGMLVAQEVAGEGDAEVHGEEVNAGDAAEGDVIQPTPPQSPRVQPQSPQPQQQPQPTHDAGIPMNLLQEVMDTCIALTRRVEHLELDKIAQALEITKLKRRVKKLERRNKVVEDAKVDESVDIQGRKAKSQAEIYKIDLEHANKVLSKQEDESEPAKVQEVVEVVTTAKIITEVVTAASETITAASTTIAAAKAQVPAVTLTASPIRVTAAPSRKRKGLVIKDPQKESTTSIIISAKTKSKDKGKGILVDEPKPLKKQQQIEQDEKYARELEGELNKNINWDEVIDHVKRKAKEDSVVKKYQALKKKPQTKAQARKNMMLYLKNTKEQIKEEESKALKRINKTPAERVAKRQKLDEEVEELKRHLQIVPNEDDDVYTEATSLARKVPVVDYEIIEQNNKPYYKIIRADERKYPLTRFTMDQMLNAVRLEVEEESEVSLELLSFGVDAAQGIQEKHAKCLMLLVKDLVLPSQDDAVD